MTNEELLDKIMYSQVPQVTILERGEYRAELLRRLGAAVSAHPQPKVDEFLATIGFDVSKGDGLGLEWEPRFIATKAFQFFAAAPAQEPPKLPVDNSHVACSLRAAVLAFGGDEDLDKAVDEGRMNMQGEWLAAQEPPAENSPQKGKS